MFVTTNLTTYLSISTSQHFTISTSHHHLNISPHHHHSMYFLNRRPRGFHHTFRFSSEQRDLLDNLRRGVSPEELAKHSLAEAEPPTRRRSSSQVRLLGVLAAITFLLLAVMLLSVL